MDQRPPYYSITLISAAALAYEILLMRLFSIIQWHHFAFMIIGLALLGYGISGTIVAIAQQKLNVRYPTCYIACLFLFGLSSVSCFLAAQSIPFNAEEIFWDWRQIVYLFFLFLLLTIPFFFAATAICLTFINYKKQIARIYALDLFGAGAGSLTMILLLFLVFPLWALFIIAIVGLIATIIASWELHSNKRKWISAGSIFCIAVAVIAGFSTELKLSPYKSLEQSLLVNGTKVIEQRSSPLGLLSILESAEIPLRHAPGLSLNSIQEPLPQLGVFTDGDNMTVITRHPENIEQLAYLDQMTSALPYHLKRIQQVLILGAGGGIDVLQAKFHTIPDIHAVELNPQLVDLVDNKFKQFTGALYQQKNISLHIGEARDYLSGSDQQYDLIQLALMDAFAASSSGLYALNESYLYTTEALQLYLAHVAADGYLSITRWLKMPPRDTLKLFITAADALKQSGSNSPDEQLVIIRSWQTSTLLIKKGKFTAQELNAIQNFCEQRSFDMVFRPVITIDQVNRFNVLNEPYFYSAAVSLLSENRNDFIDQYKFNIQPATDDRPYFHHFFKWSTLPELLRLRDKGGMPLLEWGYMIFIATLIIASLLSIVLIVMPMYFYSNTKTDTSKNIKRSTIVYYFFAIGLAFLFIEIAFIQKFILLLHHPIYAISVTLTVFLIFAGLGSLWSARFSKRRANRRAILFAVLGICLLCLFYLLFLKTLFAALATLPIIIKIIFTIVLVAPLAFFMGMPFPLALANLSKYAEQFIPWAWGINGCASVISAVLATLLAIHFGFNVVILIAMLLYISILFMYPTISHRDQ